MKPITRIHESALYVDDLEAAKQFYAEVLGLEFYSERKGRSVFFRLKDAMLLLFNPAASESDHGEFNVPAHGARGPGHMAFEMEEEELAGWTKHLEKQGVELERKIEWPGGGHSIYFRDPAGNSLEMVTRDLWKL